MIDLKYFEQNHEEAVNSLLLKKDAQREDLEELLKLIKIRRQLTTERDVYRTDINKLSESIAEYYKEKSSGAETLVSESKLKKAQLNNIEVELKQAEERIKYLHLRIPNFPDVKAPIGESEDDNAVIKYVDYNPQDYIGKSFRTHWELAEDLDLLDIKTASKITGPMFAMFKGNGAKLIRSLIWLCLDINGDEFQEILPPHCVKTETMISTGHLPKFEIEAYALRDDALWLIPTAEVPLTSIGKDEIYSYDELPKKFMGYTVCFRREAGSYGRDTRGTQRLHEFHKVELLKYVREDQVAMEFEKLLERAERIIRLLKLPYRLVDICTKDLGFSSARVIDIEVYSPALNKWWEVSSVGNFTDFQARRANIRYRDNNGKLRPLCTMNGSGMATPRVWAAILEHYQQDDGSIVVPEVLQDFMKMKKILPGCL